ncbi:hypothetical protein V8F20_002206 [Naviculisporaceae sp. PSN 640]
MAEANHRRRLNEISTPSPKIPVSKPGCLPSPTGSKLALGRDQLFQKPYNATIPSKSYLTRRRSNRTLLRERSEQRMQDARRRQSARLKAAVKSTGAVSEYTDEKRTLPRSGASSGSPESQPKTPLSRTPEVFPDDREDSSAQKTEPPATPLPTIEPDEVLLRHLALKKREQHERKKASEEYLKTGDMSVFAPFMAPFIDGPNRPNLGSWVWDPSVARWRKEHTLDGRIVWAPTDDSFI